MTVGLTDEQLQITEAVTGFAARHAPLERTRDQLDQLAAGGRPGYWTALTAEGWQSVHLPEEFGGQGGDLSAAACVIDAAASRLESRGAAATILVATITKSSP